LRRLVAAIVLPAVVTAVVAGGALGAPALAGTGARPLHLAVLKLQFTSFTCLNDACSLAQSTVTGGGHEFSAAAGPTPVIFNGTIPF
jgi:hypothetical protein